MRDTSPILDALAERLGLERSGSTLKGAVQGAPVQVTVAVIQPHHDSGGLVLDLSTGQVAAARLPLQLSVKATFPFPHRLDAGLAVVPAGGHAGLLAAGRSGPDGRLSVKGREPERVSHLVTREALVHLDRSFLGDPGPALRDGELTWAWAGLPPWPTADLLEQGIRDAAAAWSLVHAAAPGAPPPAAVADAFAVLAGMELVAGVEPWGCPAGVIGGVDGVPVAVTVAPFHTGGWLTRSRLRFPRVVPGTPKVLREERFSWVDRALAALGGRPEQVLGDDRFDRQFAIRTSRPEALAEVLDADVRSALLALDGLIPVQLGATGVEAQGPLTTERELVRTVQASLALARFLSRAF